jgi:2-dehydro-3-deoxyphosphooctonate aldolase (KDO 8-P synthase)
MEVFKNKARITEDIIVGGERLVLLAGPCAAESYDICMQVGEQVKEVCQSLDIDYVFKASFDKANRTSVDAYRGPGLQEGLELLSKVKQALDVPIVTDIHESSQAEAIGQVADVIQIPAFLCRQTDLIVASAKTGKMVNIKRGQYMAPADMQYSVTKSASTGNTNVCLTERGVSFGYHNLVVDMRALPIMRQYAPVIFDTTHSVQQPGGAGGSSGGQREFAPYLSRAAAATGVDGFFVETHPDPVQALTDGPNMVKLDNMKMFMSMLKETWELGRRYV